MRKVIVWGSVIAGLAGISYGLYRFYKSQIDLALSYCYKISGYKFNNLTVKDVNLDVFVKVLNNSSFAAEILGYSLNVSVNGRHVAKVNSNKATMIKNNGVSQIGLNVSFSPSKIFNLKDATELVTKALTDKSKVSISVNGSLSAKMNFIKLKDLPIDIKMTLAEILAPEDPKNPKQICNIK